MDDHRLSYPFARWARTYNLAAVQRHRAWQLRMETLEMRLRVREMRRQAAARRG